MKNISLIKNDKQKKEKKLTFLNHLLALDNVFSTKSEEQEVNQQALNKRKVKKY